MPVNEMPVNANVEIVAIDVPRTLSASLSREVGQKASAPSLLESLFTGAPIFWNQMFDCFFIFSHFSFLFDEALAVGAVVAAGPVAGVVGGGGYWEAILLELIGNAGNRNLSKLRDVNQRGRRNSFHSI